MPWVTPLRKAVVREVCNQFIARHAYGNLGEEIGRCAERVALLVRSYDNFVTQSISSVEC